MRIFISRDLDLDSPILAYCQDEGIELLHESMLVFSPVAFKQIPPGDWLFFYSRSGVKYFCQQLTKQHTIQDYKIACYGPSTSAFWETSMQTRVQFTGDGKPEYVPSDFMAAINEQETVVFVRAQHSKMSVQRAIEKYVNCSDIIAYQNSTRKDIQLDGHIDIALLTSPMNADAFLEQKPGFNGQIITLGTTTSTHLKQTRNRNSIPADTITEMGLLQKLKEILN